MLSDSPLELLMGSGRVQWPTPTPPFAILFPHRSATPIVPHIHDTPSPNGSRHLPSHRARHANSTSVIAPMHRLLHRQSGTGIRVHKSFDRLRRGKQRSSSSAESRRSNESNAQVNQTDDLASGVSTEEAAPERPFLRSRPTDYVPFAAIDPQPQPLSESREPPIPSPKLPSNDFGSEDPIVLIMGPAGSGKSSFISKAIGGADEGVGHDLWEGSYTKEVRAAKCVIDGLPIILVDVPAFGGAMPDVSILTKVSEWLDQVKKSKAHISAVLFFHPIADNRLRWKPWDTFYRCREWCGGGPTSQTRVDLVTTMWDEVDEDVGNERLAELQGDHWKPMIESGSATLCYWNTTESAKELLRTVISKKPDQIKSAGTLPPTATVSERPTSDSNSADIQLPRKAIHEVREVQLSELSTHDMIILIIGPVGCGKSTFISKAVGNEEGLGHTLCAGSHARGIRAIRCTHGNFANTVLLDTPGFDNMRISEKEILDMVSKSLEEVHHGQIFLSAILLLHPITDNRLRWTPLKHLRLFEKLCGKEAMARTVLVTTMWDEVDEIVGKERLAVLKSNHWKAMIALGSKTYRFWNTREAARDLLQEVISKSEEQYRSVLRQEISELKMSREIVAAQTLCSRLEDLSERRLEIMREFRLEEGGTVNEESAETLRREYAEVGAKLDVTLKQARALKRLPTLPPFRRLFRG
ncbi:hypothetical protein EDD15DRAFT_2366079 [Pisolithus albus]|nr:hypothetical protein EDD15DRAFT_2366079 [Pisolithus albus]